MLLARMGCDQLRADNIEALEDLVGGLLFEICRHCAIVPQLSDLLEVSAGSEKLLLSRPNRDGDRTVKAPPLTRERLQTHGAAFQAPLEVPSRLGSARRLQPRTSRLRTSHRPQDGGDVRVVQ